MEQQVLEKPINRAVLELNAAYCSGQEEVLTEGAMALLRNLCQEFAGEVDSLLAMRAQKQRRFDSGELPQFLPETRAIREGQWQIKNIPSDLKDRRVEITGPVDRKMIINGLNSKAKVFMADFEDAFAPSWQKLIQGQINLRDAVRKEISFRSEEGKEYRLNQETAVLMCRVRGLHLKEDSISFEGKAIPAALFDFALYFYHNYRQLLQNGSGPYFYIPKLESHVEARWWAKVFAYVEERFCLAPGTIKCTCLIETLPAVFEMDEILFELKTNIVALNCGRWDYIFSYIKTFKSDGGKLLPNRSDISMDKGFLSAYSRLLIKTCHKRGALALGGMSAFIPTKDSVDNQAVLEQVHKDKDLEARNGHDGTWVAHPGLVDTAMEIFNRYIGSGHANQLHITRDVDAPIQARELLKPCSGQFTNAGLRLNIRVALRYIEAWLSGNACVSLYGLMEDLATAEICRTLIWQWIHHQKVLDDGQIVNEELFKALLVEELAVVKEEVGASRFTHSKFTQAAVLLEQMSLNSELVEFIPCQAMPS